jgi:lysophospholipase L1-like esterase
MSLLPRPLRTAIPLAALVGAFLSVGCSDDAVPRAVPATPPPGGGGPSGGGQPGPGPSGTTPVEYKSYVTLGDSVSDKGGQGPFFYDLLVKNDDAKYPDWKGKDLRTRYGADLNVVKASRGGATSRGLAAQIATLPAELPGPVLVTITIGGNDMRSAFADILGKRDQPARDAFRDNVASALTDLTKPDRFGAGVQVRVFEATIYDPSDGTGDFRGAGCPAPLSLMDPQPTDPYFANWNGVVTDAVGAHPEVRTLDAHAAFKGHGVGLLKSGASWYVTDCIHPNAVGHNELRRAFWGAITGG